MWGGTNANSGVGKLTAIIAVTYPEGSVCTVTNGTKTYTAKDTSGKVILNVPVGDWTVSCTDGKFTASKDISLETNTAVNVLLRYDLYLYDGAEETGFTWTGTGLTKNSTYMSISAGTETQAKWARTSSTIDLTEYSTLNVELKNAATSSSYFSRIGAVTSSQVNQNSVEFSGAVIANAKSSTSLQTVTASITKLSGEYYIRVGSAYSIATQVYKVWLSH